MRIANLAGIFTGSGFVAKQGRHPQPADCGFLRGPLDIVCGDDGTISTIEPTRGDPSDADVFDASGLFATAGFVDSHTHAIHAGQRANEYFMRWSGATYPEIAAAGGGIHCTVQATADQQDDVLEQNLETNLTSMLRSGATTVEVKSGYGNSVDAEIRLLKIIAKVVGKPQLPHVVKTFLALHAIPPGKNGPGYCDEMVASLADVRANRLAENVDSFPERGFFALEDSIRFSIAAKSLGLGVKVHADEITDLRTSAAFIGLGSLSIDHLEKINDEAVNMLGREKTVATLIPATSLFASMDYADARRLINAGARVALATDFNPGTAPCATFQLTMLLAASQLKMTAAEILCAVTYNGAAALGLESDRGALAEGMAADILLWGAGGDSQRQPISAIEEVVVRGITPRHVVVSGKVCN